MTLPTCESPTTSSSDSRGALASNPTMSSCPSRWSGVRVSNVVDTQAAAASWVAEGEADAVLGPVLDDAVEGVVVVDGGPAGSPAHPATGRASSAQVVAARRRVVRGRGVADST